LTYTVDTMKEVIDSFISAGLRDQVRFIVGGNHLTEEACKYIGADAFANDASVGIKVCREWVNAMNERGATEND